MAKIKTTRYYKNIFGSIQKDLIQVSGDKNNPTKDDVFEYEFKNDADFFRHFQKIAVKTERGLLVKGKTVIGAYERVGADRDRPRPRLNSKKFKEKHNE